MQRYLLLIAVFAVASAQTPAPNSAPLRHLEYRLSEHSTSMAQSESYDGTATGMQTRGYDGTMSVDVLALAKDGGIVVRAQVQMEGKDRPEEAVTCAVYGNTDVVCRKDTPISGTEDLLLGLLGRGFYDPSRNDANGSWTLNHDGSEVSAKSVFTSKATSDPDVVSIHEHSEVIGRKEIADGYISDTDILYNTKLSVPIEVKDQTEFGVRGGDGGSAMTEMHLTKDSFASH